MTRKIVLEGITAIFIILWIYTGISKIGEQFLFMYQLAKQPLFERFALQISYGVPAVELIVAILLVIKRTRLLGLWASLVLMISFTAYVAIVLSFSKSLPCQCGGVISALSWKNHLIFNVFLTILSVIGIYNYNSLNRNKHNLKLSRG